MFKEILRNNCLKMKNKTKQTNKQKNNNEKQIANTCFKL